MEKMREVRIMRLIIGNETGHTVLENVTAEEVIDHIQEHPTHWVYVDGLQITAESVTVTDWDSVSEVKILPAMVGGLQ